MVRPKVLRRRLQKLDEYLDILRETQQYSRSEFIVDPHLYGSAERFLQLSIEAINDMASHVVVDEDLGTFERARDLPGILEEHDLIREDDRETWEDMISFRNVLVHEYVDIDRRTVYDLLQHQLDDIRRFSHVFDHFLD